MAGYAANVEFWIGEAEHCLRVIDGYEERFNRFETAQQEVVAARGQMKFDERRWIPPPQQVNPTSTADDLKRARRQVIGAMAKFLDRCARERFIDQKAYRAAVTRVS